MSVRQLFYQLVSRGVIGKTEQAYKRVCDVSGQMRLDGSLDYRKIADGHRARRLPGAWDSMQEALTGMQALYRRNYWLDQPVGVEIWCEKDALTGVIQPICERYGVPYVATRGFPSLTLMYESAHSIRAVGKPAHVYYFGDHDASGRAISQNLEPALRAHGAEVCVTRMALEPAQIAAFDLPTRPGKLTDSRQAAFAAQYGGASVELDALPPDVLTALVDQCSWENVDEWAWSRAQHIEALERPTLASVAALGIQPGTTYRLTHPAPLAG